MNALNRYFVQHFDWILELVFVINLKLRSTKFFLERFERYLHNQIISGYLLRRLRLINRKFSSDLRPIALS